MLKKSKKNFSKHKFNTSGFIYLFLFSSGLLFIYIFSCLALTVKQVCARIEDDENMLWMQMDFDVMI